MRAPSEEEILRLMREVERAEDAVDAIETPTLEATGDPCPSCGEPAEHTGTCTVCHEEGCLPPDEWAPGMNDPCLTLCVRCARPLHWACASEDGAGNPRCAGCHL